MVHQCSKCQKIFKHKYLLDRHYNRKTKCKEPSVVQISQNDILNEKIVSLDKKLNDTNTELQDTKTKLRETEQKVIDICTHIDPTKQDLTCKFCLKTFTLRTNLTRHLNSGRCRMKNDNVSIYERELNMEIPKSKHLICRFCNLELGSDTSYSRHVNSECKEKKAYEKKLEKQVLERRREASAQIINNNNNNNNNNTIGNNIIINMPKIEMNPFGQENLDYITTKLLIKELESCKAIQQADVSSIVDRFTKLIHANPAHPENQNVLFKSLNAGYARVYRHNGFQDEQSTEVQDTIIQNVQKLIQTKGCDEYDYSSNGEFADVLDDIDVNYGKVGDKLIEGTTTRALSKCRNTVKAALHSNKDEIITTHSLLKK